MFKKILLVLLVLLIGVLLYAATRPDTLHVERSATIKAPPEAIFPQINDLQAWRTWSPYEKLDPALKRTFTGPQSGKGAVYAWEGNSKAGAGSMEIVESTSPSKIVIELRFLKPMEAVNVATFTLTPVADGTRVTWALDGPCPYLSKVMGVFINMDRMIGTDFAAGLESLKALTEK